MSAFLTWLHHVFACAFASLAPLAHPCNTLGLLLTYYLTLAGQLKLHRMTTSWTFGHQPGRSPDLVVLYVPAFRTFLAGVGCTAVGIPGLSLREAKVRFPFPFHCVSLC